MRNNDFPRHFLSKKFYYFLGGKEWPEFNSLPHGREIKIPSNIGTDMFTREKQTFTHPLLHNLSCILTKHVDRGREVIYSRKRDKIVMISKMNAFVG